VANAWWVWTTDTRLERQLAEIRAAGDPVTLADLARPPIPPEKNADTYLRQADADVDAMERIIYSEELNKTWWGQYEIRQPLAPEALKALRAALATYPKVIPLLERAAVCPDFDPGLDYEVAPEVFIERLFLVVSRTRGAVRLLDLQLHLQVAEGNYDEAVRTGITILRLGHLSERVPMIMGYLVANVERNIAVLGINLALQSGLVSKDVRDELARELALQKDMPGYVWASKSERAFGIESFRDDAIP